MLDGVENVSKKNGFSGWRFVSVLLCSVNLAGLQTGCYPALTRCLFCRGDNPGIRGGAAQPDRASTGTSVAWLEAYYHGDVILQSFPNWALTDPVRYKEKAGGGRDRYGDVLSKSDRHCFLSLEETKGKPRVAHRFRDRHDGASPPVPMKHIKSRPEGIASSCIPDRTVFVQVDSGWLVCHDWGEFGALVSLHDSNGEEQYKISTHHVRDFIKHGHRIFGVGGLHHGAESVGYVLEFTQKHGRWSARELTRLPQCAHVASRFDEESLLVVCDSLLMEVKLSGEMRPIYGCIGYFDDESRATWQHYPPTSVVVVGNDVFIGVSFGVVFLEMHRYYVDEQWLLPEETFRTLCRETRIKNARLIPRNLIEFIHREGLEK